jgi:hypothetical protein
MKRQHIAAILFLPLALFFLGAPLFLAIGCKTSPERASFNATATTITTADAAIKVWFAYVQREEDRLERLKATDRGAWMAGRRALLINEGKVANAWDSYVSATRTLVLAATELQPDKTPDASRVDALRSELISLVTQLTR